MFFKKPKPIRDEKHLKRVSEMPCCCCGISPGGVAHHLLRGTGEKCGARKAGDDKTIPLCPEHHDRLHRTEEREFLSSWGVINPVEYALSLYKGELK